MGKKSETIYARVSIEIKSAVEAYAENHGMTIAATVQQLIDLGLKYQEQNIFLRIMSEAVHALKGGK